MQQYINWFLSSISGGVGGGVGLLIIIYLSKNIIPHLLKRDYEEYLHTIKRNNDFIANNYNKERELINKLWEQVIDIVLYSNDSKEIDKAVLQKKNKELELFLFKNKPFVHIKIEQVIKELVDISDIENNSADKCSDFVKKTEYLAEVMRERLLI